MSVQYKDTNYSYEVYDDGYEIFGDGVKIIKQREPYGKPIDRTKSYEENAILHIESLLTPKPVDNQEIMRADLDYVALMNDLVLPSQEEEGE